MNNFLIILVTLVIALALTIITFVFGEYSPDWLYLVVIYWILAVPNSIGLTTSWFIGLLTDVAFGTILGSNALTFVLIAFIITKTYKFVRYLTVYQQSIIIFLLLFLKQTILMWIDGMIRMEEIVLSAYYWSVLISSLVWPLVYFVLRYIRRKYDVV
ncbi:MAG: rod shape-determining protein MreD [Pseudomonadota bacterium]|nr:rod shape-determining protein MreD [Pseudomonadota bacterium]MED5430472.1 rod shape-determining protein MreD [Pseudomonadota bacterium]